MTMSRKRKSLEERAKVSAKREVMVWPSMKMVDGVRIVSLEAFLLALAKTHQQAANERERHKTAIKGLNHRLATFKGQREADKRYIESLRER